MMVTKNARDSILGDELLVARPIRIILSDMHEYLPDGSYEDMTKAEQAVIDAGIYLNMHRLTQAERILEELTADPETEQWARTTISFIQQVAGLPGTSIADYERASRDYQKRALQLDTRIAPISFQVKSPFANWLSFWQLIRRFLIVLGVRTALAVGYIVVLVGPSGSGKSYIMERVLSGRIISKKDTVISMSAPCDQHLLPLEPGEIPRGRFGVDEVQLLNPVTLAAAMSKSKSPYVLSLQSQFQLGVEIQEVIAQRKHIFLKLVR
ncbi:hypothetical protein ACO0LB_17735 [Undibacterium sp. SXout7W]|uniref:hypothetical protein n=1 Tax=Undibacterium sp. SXout7W TaxID=3413049 RepID=UPI003BF3D668